MARWMLLLILLISASAGAADYWQCEDVDAIRRGPDALAELLGAESDHCRRTSVRGVDTLNCELTRPRIAFGMSAVEVRITADDNTQVTGDVPSVQANAELEMAGQF